MLKISAFAAACALLIAGPAMAAPQPLFDTFQQVCVQTQAEPSGVAAVTRTGWRPVSPDALPAGSMAKLAGNLTEVKVLQREGAADPWSQALFLGEMSQDGKDIGPACMALTNLRAPGDMDQITAWIGGGKPLMSTGPITIYLFSEGPGGRQFIDASSADAEAQLKAGNIRMLMIGDMPKGVLLGYVKLNHAL